MSLFQHVPHPHIQARKNTGPVRVADQRPTHSPTARFNTQVAKTITAVVGTIWCFYVFNALAFVSLPAAIKTHNPTIVINWVSSNWIQLVLLPALMVGQALASAAADARADQTFKDAEAILHECLELQRHLQIQDEVLETLHERSGGAHDIRS